MSVYLLDAKQLATIAAGAATPRYSVEAMADVWQERREEAVDLVLVLARANVVAYRDQYGRRNPQALKERAPTKTQVLAEMPPLPNSPSLAHAAVTLSVLRYNTVSDKSDALKGKGFEALAQLQGMLLSRIAGE